MKKLKKISIGLLLTLVLSVSAPVICFTGASEMIVAAATSIPKPTEDKLTLYDGHKVYQIKFEKLSKNAVVTFRSSNPDIAKVSKSGIITPRARGSATIKVTIKQSKKTYTSNIDVTVSLPNIKFTDKVRSLAIGETHTFSALTNGINGELSWSVSDGSIARINKKTGWLKALKKGEVDVIASAGSFTSSCTLIIDDAISKADDKKEEEAASDQVQLPTLSPVPEPIVVPTSVPVITVAPEPIITAAPEPIITAAPQPIITAAPEPIITASPEPIITAAPEPAITPSPAPCSGFVEGTCYCGFTTTIESEWEEHQRNHVSSTALKCSRCGSYYDPSIHNHVCYLQGEYCPWCGGIEQNIAHSSNQNK